MELPKADVTVEGDMVLGMPVVGVEDMIKRHCIQHSEDHNQINENNLYSHCFVFILSVGISKYQSENTELVDVCAVAYK